MCVFWHHISAYLHAIHICTGHYLIGKTGLKGSGSKELVERYIKKGRKQQYGEKETFLLVGLD